MSEQPPDFQTLIETLNAWNVRFVIIGGLAMRLQGAGHITDDMDVRYARDPENLSTLAQALTPLHPRLRGAPADLPFRWDLRTLRSGLNFPLVTDAGNLDLLGEIAGIGSFAELWDRSKEMEVFGLRVRVASIDDLIAMKRAAGRIQDHRHLAELEQLRRLLAELKTQPEDGSAG